jgi:hypothetical protein
MNMSKILRCLVLGAVVLALANGAPVLAADDVVRKGVDLWSTVEGFAQTSFAGDPIPADFFCPGSKPFNGTIIFKGKPLVAEPASSLGSIDTVVQRLDDASFDDKGEASTRIRLMALSLVSAKPVETSCGAYDAAVSLAEEQPTTTMRIRRTGANGGTYLAPLALNVKIELTPVAGNRNPRREMIRRIDLGPGTNSVWTYTVTPRYKGRVRIDTDGDGRTDSVLPAASNFLAGVSPATPAALASFSSVSSAPIACPKGQCPRQSCHCNPDPDTWDPYAGGSGCEADHLHCVWVCVSETDRICRSVAEPLPDDPAGPATPIE